MCQGLLNNDWEVERSPVLPIHIPFAPGFAEEEEEEDDRRPFTWSELYRTVDRLEAEEEWDAYSEIADEFDCIIHDFLSWEDEYLCWREGWGNFLGEFNCILACYFWGEEEWD